MTQPDLMPSRRRALLPIAAILLFASCTGAGVAPTESPTQSAASSAALLLFTAADLTIATPLDGAVVSSSTVMFAGTAPIRARVVHDIPLASDTEVVALDGSWRLVVVLNEGPNQVTMRIGDQQETSQAIHVTYTPATAVATPTAVPDPTPTATPEPTAEPTAKPTAKPTPEPTPVPISYATINARTWAKVVKSPDNYLGKGYKLWACITQFDAATGADTFLAQASYKSQSYWYLYGENAIFTGDESRLADFVEGDRVAMSVLDLGSFSYDTQIGGNTTVPSFDIVKITRTGSCN